MLSIRSRFRFSGRTPAEISKSCLEETDVETTKASRRFLLQNGAAVQFNKVGSISMISTTDVDIAQFRLSRMRSSLAEIQSIPA